MYSKHRQVCHAWADVERIVNGARFHHVAWARGYVSRKVTAVVESYDGKFGRGFVVRTPSRISTNFHHVSYYLF